jgi:lysophospholipase L1-like esterase
VYAGHNLKTLQASPWDFHPNAEGHRLIAERFYRDLTEDPELAVPK